ncbi:MAG: hypothetical protein ABFD63_08520 [Smithella sp.]|jgi:hypothetical protein
MTLKNRWMKAVVTFVLFLTCITPDYAIDKNDIPPVISTEGRNLKDIE